MRHAVAWIVAAWFVALGRCQLNPLLNALSGAQAAKDDTAGASLLNAVLEDDEARVEQIFASVPAARSKVLANAIDWRGKTVLMHAAARDLPRMITLLLEHQARVDTADYTGGATALMLAARNGSLAAVETLAAAGASIHAATPAGTTVLMQAVANGSIPVIMRLLDLGAEPDARDASGTTALSIAASMGHASVIPALVQHGASLEATDSIGQVCNRICNHICNHICNYTCNHRSRPPTPLARCVTASVTTSVTTDSIGLPGVEYRIG